MPETLDVCAVCPRLCRHACPVAVGSSREAAVPATIASVLRDWRAGRVDAELATRAATLCVDCSRCQDACHIDTPLPTALRHARASLGVLGEPAELQAIEGVADVVALLSDERDWSAALSQRIGQPVARWQSADALGAACAGYERWGQHLAILHALVDGREVVTADGAALRVLREAGVQVAWLHERLGWRDVTASCASDAVACCGGAEPLRSHHPATAADMARRWPCAEFAADTRCSRHLAEHGRELRDVVGRLMEAACRPS